MDPRVLKATSVKAEDPAAQSPEPQALKIDRREFESEDVHAAVGEAAGNMA